jgi:transposase
MKEVWLPIEGYENLYQVSSKGRIRSLHTTMRVPGYIKKPTVVNRYHRTNLSKDKKGKSYLVHRLVAQAFLPNPDNKPYVNHKNGNPSDNRLENLEWCTPLENMSHGWAMGLINNRGENNGGAKLTEKDVVYIRTSMESNPELAERFGVGIGTINQVRCGYQWKHVEQKAVKRPYIRRGNKLTKETAYFIKHEYEGTNRDLARQLGVSAGTISDTKRGKYWPDV